MLSDEITTGSITSTLAEKKAFALKSHAYNLTEKKFKVSRIPFLIHFSLARADFSIASSRAGGSP